VWMLLETAALVEAEGSFVERSPSPALPCRRRTTPRVRSVTAAPGGCVRGLAPCRQCTTQPPLGRRQVAALRVEGSEAPERDRDLVVVGTEGAFEDGERCLQKGACFVVAAQVGQDRGQCCAVGGGVGVVGPEGGVADIDRTAGCCLSVGGASGGVGEAADVVEHGGDRGIVGSEAGGQHRACGLVQRAASSKPPVCLSSTARSLRTRAVVRSSAGRCRQATSSARR
jgi:hypothetical protein